jgi:hypothetical protein
VRVATLTVQGLEAANASERTDAALRLGPRQREALTLLAGAPDGIETSQLSARGIGSPALGRLVALGLLSLTRRQVDGPIRGEVALPAERTALVRR